MARPFITSSNLIFAPFCSSSYILHLVLERQRLGSYEAVVILCTLLLGCPTDWSRSGLRLFTQLLISRYRDQV